MRVHNVVGGQFGSEAKGHVAARIATDELSKGRRVVGCRVAGPNAGHTAYSPEGKKYALRQIPVMAVVDPEVELMIGPGSEIDLYVLDEEWSLLEADGIPVRGRMCISPLATVLTRADVEQEAGLRIHDRMGSTGKGVGAARARRIMRTADTVDLCNELENYPYIEPWIGGYDESIRGYESDPACTFIIEGTQGYGLGLHTSYYPYVTSSDCRNIDFMAMAGVSPWNGNTVTTTVVLRTFPIRVAGNSGPLENETTWEHLGKLTEGYIKPEFTTVTKKMRRVGWFEWDLAEAAIYANGGPDQCNVALTFVDYIDPECANVEEWTQVTKPVRDFIREVEVNLGVHVSQITTGPMTGVWL